MSAFSFYNDGNAFKALYIPAGGHRLPIQHGVTDIEKTDAQGNIRTLEDLHMDGLEVMVFTINAAPTTVKDVLNILDWKKDDVNVFAFHQANKAILDAMSKRLRIPAEKIPVQLEHYGNTTAVSIPLTLSLEYPKKTAPWDKVVVCAFGNGMACAAAALDLSETFFCKVHNL